MKGQMDDLHSKVLRKFHTLCSLSGMSADDKKTVVASYGVESSTDIDTHDLIDLCNALARRVDKHNATMDTLRKRVIACIGGYLNKLHYRSEIGIIKAVACRASGYEDFNKIPEDRLRSIYNAFHRYSKDMDSVCDLSLRIISGKEIDNLTTD